MTSFIFNQLDAVHFVRDIGRLAIVCQDRTSLAFKRSWFKANANLILDYI